MFTSRASVSCPSRVSVRGSTSVRTKSEGIQPGESAPSHALGCEGLIVVGTVFSLELGGNEVTTRDSYGVQLQDLPYEILAFILLYVPGEHLIRSCSKVCAQWRHIISMDHFWKLKCQKDYWAECTFKYTKLNPCVCPFPLWKEYYLKLFNVYQTRKPLPMDICPREMCGHRKRDNKDRTVNIFLVGDSGVGKTAVFSRLLGQVDKQFKHRATGKPISPTECIGFHTYTVCSNNTTTCTPMQETRGPRIQCVVWDTSGRSVYMDQLLDRYDLSHAFAVFFDITSYETFFNVVTWLNHIRNMASKGVPILLVGTKLDQRQERQVDWLEAADFALALGLPYVECSSCDGVNVQDVARYLAQAAMTYAARKGNRDD